MREAEKRVLQACFRARLWWAPVSELWDDRAPDAIPKAVARGFLVYDEDRHAVHITMTGRRASGLPDFCVLPSFRRA